MQVKPIQLHKQNQLITDYRNNKESIMKYFDYLPIESFEKRVEDLKKRNFDRGQLTNILHKVNQQWDAPESTFHNIERLKNENSVVVIGGQQAGLLTGPMYTINKIISIIQLAKQQEADLQIPVIPVFWIAGEDHDFAEINHIYLSEIPAMQKYNLQHRVLDKRSVSHLSIDEPSINHWLNSLFEQLKETQYTKDLYKVIANCLDQSKTYVDFFARVIFQLYKEEGLVLIDSAHPDVRQMESNHFVRLIEKQPEISAGVYNAFQQVKKDEYTISLDLEARDAHLFYHLHNERILLTKNETGDWVGKQNEITFTTEELIEVAKHSPELLSNNVVTRPLMQELLFPTLAFIGGPGEIGYWAVLKPAFHSLEINMPPVVPRLSFTYIERNVEKALNKFDISAEHAINHGIMELKEKWLAAKSDPPIQKIANDIKETINKAHKPLSDAAQEIGSDLGDLAKKNLFYLHADVEYLEDRIMKELIQKYAKDLHEFDRINNALNPEGGLQERIWNPLQWVNEHGTGFIKNTTSSSCSFDQAHYVIYL